jgi:nanoRNase/pAp phosphatase (c-di-AMP/oligoRNAs hydrolase)
MISENQVGFKENCRTPDHVPIVRTIIDHYKNKKVYAAFVDLRKV